MNTTDMSMVEVIEWRMAEGWAYTLEEAKQDIETLLEIIDELAAEMTKPHSRRQVRQGEKHGKRIRMVQGL